MNERIYCGDSETTGKLTIFLNGFPPEARGNDKIIKAPGYSLP